ncbi:MAG: oligosaccharide flippase family protein [Litoreibacter sp.]|uniref:oligosaccharide flippase family protein n=1 Tax=Litoreibacter sp. TaxID=1969459 RepID=UPI0032990F3D
MKRIAILLSGHSLAALATLTRNLVLARMLGPENYALAVALIVLLAAAEMATTLGLPQQIVSHKQGGTRQHQNALQTVQLLRGLIGAAIVLAIATPLANALDAPDARYIFVIASCIPLLLGIKHLDPFRFQRQQRHLPHILVLGLPPALSFLALWPVTTIWSGPIVMLYLMLFQTILTVVISHAVSRRRYCLRLSRPHFRTALRFGLPLAGNGVLMLAVLHAEKVIAGVQLGLSEMGILAMGITLTLTPALISARCLQAYYLPKLKGTDHSILGISFLSAAALAIALSASVPLFLPILGHDFEALAGMIPLLSLIAACRLPKSALATAALAQGRTHLPAFANIPRAIAAPIIWVALANGGTIHTMLVIALTAEIAGLAVGYFMGRKQSTPANRLVNP